jgi:hypothetical protein
MSGVRTNYPVALFGGKVVWARPYGGNFSDWKAIKLSGNRVGYMKTT